MPETLDIKKLQKVLAMTTSLHDGEALNAIRAANDMLAKAGKTWIDVTEDLLGTTVSRSEDGVVWENAEFKNSWMRSDAEMAAMQQQAQEAHTRKAYLTAAHQQAMNNQQLAYNQAMNLGMQNFFPGGIFNI